jgi:hypothetical protein
MRADLVAVVLLPHLKQLALDGTAPFASVSFEFPLGDHLHLCRQSFCFRVMRKNCRFPLRAFLFSSLWCDPSTSLLVLMDWLKTLHVGTVHTVLVIHVHLYLQYCIISCVFSSVDFSFSFSNAGGM